MPTNSRIRIIKRGERGLRPAETFGDAEAPVLDTRQEREAAPRGGDSAAITITGWINELQQQKKAEALTAARALKRSKARAA